MPAVFRHQVALLLVCFSVSLFAQDNGSTAPATPPPQRSDPHPQVDRHVTLDVVVTDKAGHPIPGLQQSDFTLLDDKQPQPITSFRAVEETSATADPPLQVILLIDAVNTAYQGVVYQRNELIKFLQRDNGHLALPMSLFLLSDTSTQIQPTPSRDGNALVSALNANESGLRIIGRSQGFYGGADRVQISIKALEQLIAFESKQPGRKLLVWLSPGWPLLSGPNVQMTEKGRESIFKTVVGLSTALREARITLYSVDPAGMSDAGSMRTFYYESFLKGVPSANKVDNGNLGLQVLAVQSGGRVLNSSNDVARLIATCMDDSKAYYTLTFDSPRADHPDEYHSLQIQIGKPKLTARTRTGYYAQP